jgi:hypothetical protein
MEAPNEPESPAARCPNCDGEIDAPAMESACPHCGADLMVIVDDTREQEAPPTPQRDEELDGLKIRQLIALRRGAIRARSWCLIAAAVCVVAAIQLIIKTVRNVRHMQSWGLRATGFTLFAVGALMVAGIFLRRAAELKREIEQPTQSAPSAPPDFEALSDGSRRWKNLEDLTD